MSWFEAVIHRKIDLPASLTPAPTGTAPGRARRNAARPRVPGLLIGERRGQFASTAEGRGSMPRLGQRFPEQCPWESPTKLALSISGGGSPGPPLQGLGTLPLLQELRAHGGVGGGVSTVFRRIAGGRAFYLCAGPGFPARCRRPAAGPWQAWRDEGSQQRFLLSLPAFLSMTGAWGDRLVADLLPHPAGPRPGTDSQRREGRFRPC